jgi:phosphoglycolate phosphatase-like HAD superfamily hydrolase
MKDIKVVAFDCDGVLFDTEEANRAYYDHLLKHFGRLTLTPEQFAYAHQHTLNESIAYLFEDQEAIAAVYAYRQTMDYSAYLKLLKAEPDLVPLLTKIRAKLKTAIATNRSDTMNRLLAEFALTEYFDLVVTSFDIRRPLDHFGIEAHQALYVGDSQVDAEAARAAKIPFVAFRNETLPAEYHIGNLKELEEILEV